MAFEVVVVVEHLNHLGIVTEVCREIGVAEWLKGSWLVTTSSPGCAVGPTARR